MGGDSGPEVVVPAVIRFLNEFPDIDIVLYGLEDELLKSLPHHDPSGIARCRVQFSSQIVIDNESPSAALRHKQDSSMWLALEAVAQGSADACISGGNTGALVAMGLKLMGVYKGVDRPAICTVLPMQAGRCYMLDVGANVDCAAQQLQQFAAMATALVSGLEGIKKPTVALLNVGKESIKGNKVVKQAAELFGDDHSLNYLGFIEADELLQSRADIVVCDGFTGNIALKATEGTARYILAELAPIIESYGTKEGIPESISAGLLVSCGKAFNPGSYNGAILLGLNGVVVKSHGNADENAYCGALERAAKSIRGGVSTLIKAHLEKQGEL